MPSRPSAEVTIKARVGKSGAEPILGAAYLMMDRAYVLVSGDKKKALTVTLRPKAGRGAAALAALRKDFAAELAAQELRWAVARNNRSIREYVAENALALSQEYAARSAAPAEPASEPLTGEQRSEIERLIAEVETEIAAMNAKKDHAGAKETSQSWEAAQDVRKAGDKA
jgi:His-Xaa-Ser system protein HxsD